MALSRWLLGLLGGHGLIPYPMFRASNFISLGLSAQDRTTVRKSMTEPTGTNRDDGLQSVLHSIPTRLRNVSRAIYRADVVYA